MSKINEYNPDVLSCISNLSNDEVFTPPEIVNNMLDMLPKEIWEDKSATFLDPCCKTGVFLREIAKRLLIGLENQIPDLQERIDHIFHNQLFGIAVTELTSLLSRRSVYCSKYPNCKYSITSFDNIEGNIRFKRVEHTWYDGRCIYCGATKKEYNRDKTLENYAYEMIHSKNIERMYNMKFDVIIGNPPYQLTTGGAQAQAIPLYHKFIEQSKKLNPRYLCMIIPSRWFTGGFGLDSFRNEMINDKRISVLHDFLDASECFPGVDIKGGVCYFLWDRSHNGLCDITTHQNGEIVSNMKRYMKEENLDIFIRYNDAMTILNKVMSKKEESLSNIISSQRPFGLPTNFSDFTEKKKETNDIKLYANKKIGYLPEKYDIQKNEQLIMKWKVLTPKAIGSGESKDDWVKPILAEPNSVSTETYVVLGAFDTKDEAKNLISYTQTKFFHFLLTLRKNTQDALSKAYSLIPIQNFNESWNDSKLYEKYGLNDEEIRFIDVMVRDIPEYIIEGENNE